MKKNIWFWASILEFAIIVCLIIFIFAFGTGMTNEYNDLVKEFDALEQANVKETATKAKKDEDTSSIENPSPNKDKVYKINEEAIIANEKNEPMYSLKIVSVEKGTNETSDSYTDGKPENALEITYEYKNYNMESPFKISSQFISASNIDGKTGKTMNMMDGQTEVSQGRSSQSKIWVIMQEPVSSLSEINIDYNNDFALGFTGSVTFNINL